MAQLTALVSPDQITHAIHVIRGHRVMLDADLARLYRVTTKRLNQAVKRNQDRFPEDFMFRLTPEELDALMQPPDTSGPAGSLDLRSQIVTSRSAWGGHRYPPAAFTEHGVVMLASVLNSRVAVVTSLQIVRAFVRLRGILAIHADLARKLQQPEQKYDAQFRTVFDAIRELMRPLEPPAGNPIGFRFPGPPVHQDLGTKQGHRFPLPRSSVIGYRSRVCPSGLRSAEPRLPAWERPRAPISTDESPRRVL